MAIAGIDVKCSRSNGPHRARDKFNKTLTIASIRIIDQLITESTGTDFNNFIAQNPKLITDFKGLLKRHYGFDIFTSQKAKKEFLEPDLLPLGK